MQELPRHNSPFCTGESLYAYTVFYRAKPHLQKLRRREQSGFTSHRSRVDRIATLKLIWQRRRELQKPFWVAYVYFRSAFDSVDRKALWLLLEYRAGIPQKLTDLMEDLYTVSCVQTNGVQSDRFPFSAEVRQGCNITPNLFLEPIDWIINRTIHRVLAGVSFGGETFTDLDFANDVTLLSEILEMLIISLEIMHYL